MKLKVWLLLENEQFLQIQQENAILVLIKICKKCKILLVMLKQQFIQIKKQIDIC